MYAIKEIYYTIQGEGVHAGKPAIFCRFSGCNLWSGLEKDRTSAVCQFCDTDFWGTDGVNGGKYSASELVEKCTLLWPKDSNATPFVVCTGGEPLLQLDTPLINRFHAAMFYIAIETNGTLDIPPGIDWVCVSPKAGANTIVKKGDELKLVYPQEGLDPKDFEEWDFKHFSLQPMDNENIGDNTEKALQYCLQHPKWNLSIQVHKILNIP